MIPIFQRAASIILFMLLSLCHSANAQSASSGETKFNIASTVIKGNLIFAGTNRNGVYVSSDSGRNWKSVSNGLLPDATITSFYASGNNLIVVSFMKVFVSTNDGANWAMATLGPADNVVGGWGSIVEFKNKVFIPTRKGLYVSADNGVSWTLSPITGPIETERIAANDNYMVAQTDAGQYAYYSSKDGVTAVTTSGISRMDKLWATKDYIIAERCAYSFNRGDFYTCRAYELAILNENGKKWEEIELTSRIFVFDKANIYAIKARAEENKQGKFEYKRDVLVSKNRGKKWEKVDEKTDPFVTSDINMKEKLQELDDWKDLEIEEAVVAKQGLEIMKEQYAQRRAEIRQSHKGGGYQPTTSGYSPAPDYRQLSNDRLKEKNNTRDTWIDSQGKLHIH